MVAAPLAHADETGVRVGRALQWLHVLYAARLTAYFPHPKCGGEAIAACDLLTDPGFLKSAREDFDKQLNGRTYKTLNDFETSPLGKLDTAETKNCDCCIHAAMEHFGIKEHQ